MSGQQQKRFSPPSFCRQCGALEDPVANRTGNFKLSQCKACHTVAYCSKDCQRSHWKQHKPHCKAVVALVFNNGGGGDVTNTISRDQRRMRGTSAPPQGSPHAGNREGLNVEAERLAQQARQDKRECRFDSAIALYTKALQLDPYNHWYFHYRGETFMVIPEHFGRRKPEFQLFYGMAITDAQCALDLEPSADVPWFTMIRSALNSEDLDHAQQWIDVALQVIPSSNGYARKVLFRYKNDLEEIQMNPTPGMAPKIVPVIGNRDDKYYYVYTFGHHNHGRRPELLAVDLEMAAGGIESGAWMLKWVSDKCLAGELDMAFGDIYRVPFNTTSTTSDSFRWISVIPVDRSLLGNDPEEVERMRRGILPLLGMVQAAANIVVLKVHPCKGSGDEESRPSPLSEAGAKEYLRALVEKAHDAAIHYGRGESLAGDL